MQDSLTIGIVLFLLIAALGVYIWLRFQQVETRLSLVESILHDMKMLTQSFSQFPSVPEEPAPANEVHKVVYAPSSAFSGSGSSVSAPIVNITKMDSMNEMEPLTELMESPVVTSSSHEEFPSVLDEMKKEMYESSSADITIHQAASSFSGASTDYNGMTLKDLRVLAKSRGVSGTGSMNRAQLIGILQEKEASAEPVQIEYDIANDGQE
jgi:hypothetical protein